MKIEPDRNFDPPEDYEWLEVKIVGRWIDPDDKNEQPIEDRDCDYWNKTT